jgi:tetratricopeptide (TPR) repeat protein
VNETDVEGLRQAALDALSRGDFGGAIAIYRGLLESLPEAPDLHANLAVALSHLGQWEASVPHYRKALEAVPNAAQLHAYLGHALRRLGRLDEAAASLRRTLELDPSSAGTHVELGIALAGLGSADAAIAEFKSAIALDANNEPARVYLGVALGEKGELQEAVAQLRAAVEVAPQSARAHSNLAVLLREIGDRSGAIEHYRKLVEFSPDAANVHSNLGVALHENGQLDEAIAEHRQAIALDPAHAAARTNLATALHARGDVDEAIAHLRSAVELAPELLVAHAALSNALYVQGSAAAALAHSHHAWWLHRNAGGNSRLPSSLKLFLVKSFTEGGDAPLAALQVLSELARDEGPDSLEALARRTVQRCGWVEGLLDALHEDSAVPPLERVFLEAALTFHLGAPAHTYELIDRAEAGELPLDQAVHAQYYFERAAAAIAAPERAAIGSWALGVARRAAAAPASSALELYYAGLLLLEASEPQPPGAQAAEAQRDPRALAALACFERAASVDPAHLPSAYMHALCLHRLQRAGELRELVSRLLKLEEHALPQGRGFLQPEPIALGLERKTWRPSIQHAAHSREIAQAVQVVRALVEDSAYAASAERAAPAAELFRVEADLAEWLRSRASAHA